MKRALPQYGWALIDDTSTYVITLHVQRRDAEEERRKWADLRDAKWRIVKFAIKPAK